MFRRDPKPETEFRSEPTIKELKFYNQLRPLPWGRLDPQCSANPLDSFNLTVQPYSFTGLCLLQIEAYAIVLDDEPDHVASQE